jgi:hypothetical protein
MKWQKVEITSRSHDSTSGTSSDSIADFGRTLSTAVGDTVNSIGSLV